MASVQRQSKHRDVLQEMTSREEMARGRAVIPESNVMEVLHATRRHV